MAISSPRNVRVQAARRLRRRSHRDREGAFLVEGAVLVADALGSGADVDEVFVVPGASDEIERLAAAAGVPVYRVNERVLGSIADAATPQGVVARVRYRDAGLDELVLKAGLVVVLADVRDPGNAGTLIRSALAVGADAVMACSGAVDLLHPKSVRAAAGATFRIPLVRAGDFESAAADLRMGGLVIVGADQSGARVWGADLTRPIAIVVGNEAWGLAPSVRAALDEILAIPMPGPAESLNAGIAGSLLLFEALRQRSSVYPRNP
ncbi:MAG: TrmH family RNA methyltransferase [Actinomycetota bacterium]